MNIGDVFIDEYPVEALEFASSHGARILEIGSDGEHRQFRIVKNSEPSISDRKAEKLREINKAYNIATSSLISSYPQTELLTFDKQEQEARSYTADASSPTPFLSGIASARGITLDDLVGRVIVKSEAFAKAVASLTGQRQRYEDLLEAATTVDEIEAVVPEYSIPEGLDL